MSWRSVTRSACSPPIFSKSSANSARDSLKPVVFAFEAGLNRFGEAEKGTSLWSSVEWKPADRLTLSVGRVAEAVQELGGGHERDRQLHKQEWTKAD